MLGIDTLPASVYQVSTLPSELDVGQTLRRDPFAMLPFMGYNVGDYINHWIEIGEQAPDPSKLPQLFWVNWFRKGEDGSFLWPGFGENSRVLKWVFDRESPWTVLGVSLFTLGMNRRTRVRAPDPYRRPSPG